MSVRYSAVWFDLDGTLMDTAKDLVPTIIATVEAAGISVNNPAAVKSAVSDGSRAMLAAALGVDREDAKVSELLPDFLNRYERNTGTNSDYFAGMEAMIEKLEEAGIPWGIVTNKHERFGKAIVAQKKLGNRIAVMVGGDTLPRAKPYPDPLLFACASINVLPENCLFLGDAKTDIDAAKAAGMESVACAWGYIAADDDPTLWQATYLIHHPSELAQIIWCTEA